MHEEQQLVITTGQQLEPNVENHKQLESALEQETWNLFFQIIIGCLFFNFSTQPGYQGDENSCVELKKFTYLYAVITLITCVIHFLMMLITYASKSYQLFQFTQGCIGLFYIIFGVVIWIFIWIALSKQEDCGSLKILVWVFTIFIIIGLVCGFCVICFGCCLMIAEKQQPQQHQQPL